MQVCRRRHGLFLAAPRVPDPFQVTQSLLVTAACGLSGNGHRRVGGSQAPGCLLHPEGPQAWGL